MAMGVAVASLIGCVERVVADIEERWLFGVGFGVGRLFAPVVVECGACFGESVHFGAPRRMVARVRQSSAWTTVSCQTPEVTGATVW